MHRQKWQTCTESTGPYHRALRVEDARAPDLARLLLRSSVGGGKGRLTGGAGATLLIVDGLAADGALSAGAGVHPPAGPAPVLG